MIAVLLQLAVRVCDYNISLVSEICSHFFLRISCLTNPSDVFFRAHNMLTTCIRNEASLDAQEAKDKIQQVQIQIS